MITKEVDEVDEQGMVNVLIESLYAMGYDEESIQIRTFEEAGNKGLVLSFPSGNEFQVTVVQSRRG
ncbi:MAG: hypothetical protein C4570_07845 [Ammonifex sp.]|nr:MAG: hypothetical protein C4570_07845 [Ammonifex sp.]